MLVYPDKKSAGNDENYFEQYSFYREPFSTATDPDFFYQTRQHFGTLQQLQMSVKLNRGMCLITGEAGTGKTALCMRLKKRLETSEKNCVHIMTARPYDSPKEFLNKLHSKIAGQILVDADEPELKKHIEDRLIADKKQSGITTTVLIDDAHKLPYWCFEILKELLSLEVTGRKVLQVIVFGQSEIKDIIAERTTLEDMIGLYRELEPLNFRDTRQMIRFRLKMASNSPAAVNFFTWPGILAVYLASGGYPRRIVNLCHRSFMSRVPKKNARAGWYCVKACSKKVFTGRNKPAFSYVSIIVWCVALLGIAGVLLTNNYDTIERFLKKNTSGTQTVVNLSEPDQTPVALSEKGPVNSETVQRAESTTNEPPVSPPVKIPPAVTTPTVMETSSETEPLQVDETPVVSDLPPVDETPVVADAPPVDDTQSVYTNTVPPSTAPVREEHTKLDIPETIGMARVSRGDSFMIIVERIYGHSIGKYSRIVAKANPQIGNVGNLSIGDIIYFPAIIDSHVIPKEEVNDWWVRLSEVDNLNAGASLVKDLREQSVPVSLISFHHPYEGMKYYIILKKVFNSKDEAASEMADLSTDLSKEAKIIQFSFDNVAYFADPYFK